MLGSNDPAATSSGSTWWSIWTSACNQDFINHSQTVTIGPAEGATLFVLGKQDDAPTVDLHLAAR